MTALLLTRQASKSMHACLKDVLEHLRTMIVCPNRGLSFGDTTHIRICTEMLTSSDWGQLNRSAALFPWRIQENHIELGAQTWNSSPRDYSNQAPECPGWYKKCEPKPRPTEPPLLARSNVLPASKKKHGAVPSKYEAPRVFQTSKHLNQKSRKMLSPT